MKVCPMATRALFKIPFLAVLAVSAPALARPGGWPHDAWGAGGQGGGYGREPFGTDRRDAPDSREGRVDVARFVAEDASALDDPAPMRIVALPGGTDEGTTRAIYEAALVDQLVRAGYDTMGKADDDARVIEMRVVRDVLVPAESKKNPVSGEATVGVSNRGSMMAMAVNVDLSDPKKALLSTRLELRIRDHPNGAVLWEGHAAVATRDGDDNWDEAAIANRLAAALFEGFPMAAQTVDPN